MTKDHIVPASFGGENVLSNLQTMCEWCNNGKGQNILTTEAVEEIKNNITLFNSLPKSSAQQKIFDTLKSKCFSHPVIKDLYELQFSYY
jgi:5-methylcytosine-specific restriction endonuclease McrA